MTWKKCTRVILGGLAALACSGNDSRPGTAGGDTDTDVSSNTDTSDPSSTMADSSSDSTEVLSDAGQEPTDSDASTSPDASGVGTSDQADAGPPPPVTGRYDAGTPGLSDASVSVPTPCTGSRAFLATGGAFVHPTPPEMAQSLNRYIYNTGVMSVVLQATDTGPVLAASYTVDSVNGHTFGQLQPEFVAGVVSSTGFASVETQAEGFMLLEREMGRVELPLSNISLQAVTTDNCLRAVITLSAVIQSQYIDRIAEDTASDVDAGDADAGEGRGGDGPSTSIRVLLEAELVPFDFQSLL